MRTHGLFESAVDARTTLSRGVNVDECREAKVSEFDVSVVVARGEKQILGLEIAMTARACECEEGASMTTASDEEISAREREGTKER